MPTYIPNMVKPKCCGEVLVSVVWNDGLVTWRCQNPKCNKILTTYPRVIPDPEPVLDCTNRYEEIPRDDFKFSRPSSNRFSFV